MQALACSLVRTHTQIANQKLTLIKVMRGNRIIWRTAESRKLRGCQMRNKNELIVNFYVGWLIAIRANVV